MSAGHRPVLEASNGFDFGTMHVVAPVRQFRTPGSSPVKTSFTIKSFKPIFTEAEGSPSPTKITRAVSMFSRPSGLFRHRGPYSDVTADCVFAVDDIQIDQDGSSLSRLSNALEKLKVPAPSGPSTSLGFNISNTTTTTVTTNGTASLKSSSIPKKIPARTGTRLSARQAAKATANADSSSPISSTGPAGPGKKAKGVAASLNTAESPKILNNCTIFVDVRTDDGEEVSRSFMEKLQGLGANVSHFGSYIRLSR